MTAANRATLLRHVEMASYCKIVIMAICGNILNTEYEIYLSEGVVALDAVQ